jgi:hypothetical protein
MRIYFGEILAYEGVPLSEFSLGIRIWLPDTIMN